VSEDLGGGLKAIGQYDMRFNLDAAYRNQAEASLITTSAQGTPAANVTRGSSYATGSPTVNFAAGGNSHVGLAGNFGSVRLGRQDIYYVDTPSLLPAGLYLAANSQPVFHALATANASRTPNLLWWVSPRINGFEGTVAYSTNPLRASGTNEGEADVGTRSATRKGSGMVLRLNYVNGPIDATFVNMDYKSDYTTAGLGSNCYTQGYFTSGTNATAAAGSQGACDNGQADQKGNTLVLKYQVNNALRVAFGMSDEKTILTSATSSSSVFGNADPYGNGYNPAGNAGQVKSARATSFSASYDMGAWNFAMNQANRGNYKFDGLEAASTGASITTLAATYNFSKRTAAGLMWTTLKNDGNNATGLFYQANNAYGGQSPAFAGENHNITSLALRHNF
jgi:predicted porin